MLSVRPFPPLNTCNPVGHHCQRSMLTLKMWAGFESGQPSWHEQTQRTNHETFTSVWQKGKNTWFLFKCLCSLRPIRSYQALHSQVVDPANDKNKLQPGCLFWQICGRQQKKFPFSKKCLFSTSLSFLQLSFPFWVCQMGGVCSC